jgi:hypothetical protein
MCGIVTLSSRTYSSGKEIMEIYSLRLCPEQQAGCVESVSISGSRKTFNH